jgi:GAF domain-containing protein
MLCAPFVDGLPVTGASISVFGADGRQSTVSASDPIAARAETLQFELGEGPHWQALADGLPILCPDLSSEGVEWPIFRHAARELGIAALFAFPIVLGAVIVGVVDLYRLTPGRLDSDAVSRASSMAGRVASAAVLQATASADSHESDERAMAPAMRREVHQATGMILAQLDIPATDAFLRLRAHAFASGRTVEDVAHDVVVRLLDFSTMPE